jgi:hypothetical protein
MKMNPAVVAAVDAAIAATGVARYRYLALEQPDPVQRRVWQDWILAGRPAQRVTPDPAGPGPAVDYRPVIPPGRCGGCPG